MAYAAAKDIRKIYLAILREIEVFIAARALLPEENVAHAGLTAAIEHCSVTLGQQYLTGASVVKIILENEMQNYNNVELHPCGRTEVAEGRQGLFNIWRSLQSTPIEKLAVEDAVLTAFFSRTLTVELDDKAVEARMWSIPMASILSPDKCIRTSDLTLTHDAKRGVLVISYDKKLLSANESTFEMEIKRLTQISHSPSGEHIRLKFHSSAIDLQMHTSAQGGRLVDRLKLVIPIGCQIQEVGELAGLMKSKESTLRRKRGFEAISD
ncbi:MAG: hypothetical protein Q9173_005341 [Seirophora scorigena]